MKKLIIAWLIISVLFLSSCIYLPIRERIEPEDTEVTTEEAVPESSESEGPVDMVTSETSGETTETPLSETTAEPTPDPDSAYYGGITITYDYFEDEYQDADDDIILASGYLQNVTVSIESFPAAAELINDTLDGVRSRNTAAYSEICVDAQSVYDDFGMSGLIGPYEVNAVVEPTYVSNKIISFSVSVYEYRGGAHGGVVVESYSFDARTGDDLTLDDLCSDSVAFEHFVHNQIIDQIEAVPPEDRMLFDDYATTVVSAFPRASWLFSDQTGELRFVVTYQQYDIAPYAAGLPGYEISVGDCLSYFNAYGQSLFEE
ncbi:MAG: DUF4163 domain-containing protein [Clostridiales bacterium]|nr:DUF4163 domain-containing protein [Clostridiales bacterium]